jgi:anthranilate synthase/aminodeoxychorismate synthase-like glutamine amidotransferase
MPLVLIDNYDSFTYNLYQMVQSLTQDEVQVYRNDKLDFAALKQLRPTGVILSPGPGHPANASDFGVCREVIVKQSELNCPVFGVCLGHQGMVEHLGGKVVSAPEIVHGKMSLISIVKASPILQGLSSSFLAMRYHSLVVSAKDFPAELEVTATEGAHGLIMALQHRQKPMYGVQFHPESIGTPEGKHILKNFVSLC